MKGRTLKIGAVSMVLLAVILVSNQFGIVRGQQKKTPGDGFAAVPGLKGGQDAFGPYDPVQNWPRPLAESLPNHEGWTWSQSTDVFAESPDRVFVTQKGELPVLPIYWYTNAYIIQPSVQNWYPLVLGNHNYKYIDLREESASEARPR